MKKAPHENYLVILFLLFVIVGIEHYAAGIADDGVLFTEVIKISF